MADVYVDFAEDVTYSGDQYAQGRYRLREQLAEELVEQFPNKVTIVEEGASE